MTFSKRSAKGFSGLAPVAFAIILSAIAVRADNLWIDRPEFDFGFVPPNTTLVYRSWIHNSGTDSLLLTDIKTGCGCLAGSPAQAVLQPGDSLPIQLSWQTRALDAPLTRSAYVYLDKQPDPIRVELTGRPRLAADSTDGVASSPIIVRFDSLGVAKRNIRLRNLTAGELTVSLVMAPDSIVNVDFPDVLPARGEGLLVVAVTDGSKRVPLEDSFTLEFKSQAGYTYRLSIPIMNGDFSYRPVFSKTGL